MLRLSRPNLKCQKLSINKGVNEQSSASPMNKVNYAIKIIKDELKKRSLSLNVSNISSLTDDNSVVSTASTNVTSGTSSTSSSKSSLESEASNATKKRQAIDINSSQK
jgi:hypothetical protein